MISIFRKARQGLLSTNKIGKYLVYAGGEILLVVAGILVALQIDTWREEQTQNELTELLLSNVYVEIERNLEEAEEIMKYNIMADSLHHLILSGTLTKEDYIANPELFYPGRFFVFTEFHSMAYDAMVQHRAKLPKKYAPVIERLKLLYTSYIPRVHSTFDDMLENIDRDIEYQKRNLPWVSYRGMELSKAYSEYATTNQYFKNEISIAALKLDDYFSTMTSFQYEAMLCHQKISEVLEFSSLGKEKFRRVRSVDAALLKEYQGTYVDQKNEKVEKVRIFDDRLSLFVNSAYYVVKDTFLVSFGYDRFLLFHRNDMDDITGFTLKEYGREKEYIRQSK